MTRPRRFVACFCLLTGATALALDQNHNAQSDVWKMIYKATGLAETADADGDGWSNAAESAAGTNPLDPKSYPRLQIATAGPSNYTVSWEGLAGKRYSLLTSDDLAAGSWEPAVPDLTGQGAMVQQMF